MNQLTAPLANQSNQSNQSMNEPKKINEIAITITTVEDRFLNNMTVHHHANSSISLSRVF